MDAPQQEDSRRLRADKAFKRQEDGALAMSEYQAGCLAVRAKTVRLREQRLAKQAREAKVKADAAAAANNAAVIPTKSAKPKRRAASAKATAKAAEMAGRRSTASATGRPLKNNVRAASAFAQGAKRVSRHAR